MLFDHSFGVDGSITYWFETLSSDKRNYHKTRIKVIGKKVVDTTCTCKHGTLSMDFKKRPITPCKHIKGNLKELKEYGLVNES